MTRSEPTIPGLVGTTPGATSLEFLDRLSAADGVLLGLDFDGTLVPIADDPDEPELSRSVRQILRTLASHDAVRVAVVSGRELDDVMTRVAVPGIVYAGNHGLELHRNDERIVPRAPQCNQEAIRTAHRQLCDRLSSVPGSHIENKGLTLTVHVRRTPTPRVSDVRRTVNQVATHASGIRVDEGKQVFEVKPVTYRDKGTVLARLSEALPDSWIALFLGDDTTDEDAFRDIQPDGIGIHVGSDADTVAEYRLPAQEAVPAFLRWFVDSIDP